MQGTSGAYYELRHDVDRFKWVTCEAGDDLARVLEVGPDLLAALWEPVALDVIEEESGDRSLPMADFPVFTHVVRCISHRAAAVMGDMLAPAGEFLEATGLGGNYVLWHATALCDALIPQKTDRLPVAGRQLRMRMSEMRGDVFGIPTDRTTLIVSEAFRLRVEQERLTGLWFKPVELA